MHQNPRACDSPPSTADAVDPSGAKPPFFSFVCFQGNGCPLAAVLLVQEKPVARREVGSGPGGPGGARTGALGLVRSLKSPLASRCAALQPDVFSDECAITASLSGRSLCVASKCERLSNVTIHPDLRRGDI